jgi:hypothetical protein
MFEFKNFNLKNNYFVDILSTIGGLVLDADANVCGPGGVVRLFDEFNMEVVGDVKRDCVALD